MGCGFSNEEVLGDLLGWVGLKGRDQKCKDLC